MITIHIEANDTEDVQDQLRKLLRDNDVADARKYPDGWDEIKRLYKEIGVLKIKTGDTVVVKLTEKMVNDLKSDLESTSFTMDQVTQFNPMYFG